ncbi:hypothetical protein FPQ18DRAFT_303051 [Pyronema domesticum]|nr:hypothetical protein FPQ18DRAFT_303051 [Pyronema domesticum]
MAGLGLDTLNAVIKVDAKIDRLDEKTDDVKVIVKELRDDNSKRREEETITQNRKARKTSRVASAGGLQYQAGRVSRKTPSWYWGMAVPTRKIFKMGEVVPISTLDSWHFWVWQNNLSVNMPSPS